MTSKSDINARDRQGRTPLFYATRDGEHAIVDALIQAGASVNAQDASLMTPLHFAAIGYQPCTVELLLKSGATVDSPDENGNTALSTAVFESKGLGEVIELLLKAGGDRHSKNKHGVSPKALAESVGNYDIRRFLVD